MAEKVKLKVFLFLFFEAGFLCIALTVLQLPVSNKLASNSKRFACLGLCLQVLGLKVCTTASLAKLKIFRMTDLRLN